MNRNDLIENLIQAKMDDKSTRKSKFIFYGILIFISFLHLYLFIFSNYQLSFLDIISCICGILLLIFYNQYYTIHVNIKYLYFATALLLYTFWIAILVPESYNEILEFGFPHGWQCLAEIIMIGFILGVFLKKAIVFKNSFQHQNIYWIAFAVAIGTGFMLINILCEVPSSSHDFIWHGMIPILLIFSIFFRKL